MKEIVTSFLVENNIDKLWVNAKWCHRILQNSTVGGDFACMHFFEQVIDAVLDARNMLSTACVQLAEDLFERFTVQLRNKQIENKS